DPTLPVPAADVLVGELSRFEQPSGGHPLFAGDESLGFHAFDSAAHLPEARPRGNRKLLIGVVGLLVIAIAGVIGAVQLLADHKGAPNNVVNGSTPTRGAGTGPVALKLAADQVRAIDSPTGDRTELVNADRAVDGNPATAWSTQCYRSRADFGGLKKGMGLLIDLGAQKRVEAVKAKLNERGATVEQHAGNKAPGASSAARDGAILDGLQSDYPQVGQTSSDADTTAAFPGPADPVRYLIVWITKLPPGTGGCAGFQVGIQDIAVDVQP
ncbi:MAG: eukaryotic-like serine/threonine-protein kinase, partial [Micromonosporaceae bacterium]|nr:eukaryotic-like serine/threonine-protein kinase [Micromonosporaceae bacterium]